MFWWENMEINKDESQESIVLWGDWCRKIRLISEKNSCCSESTSFGPRKDSWALCPAFLTLSVSWTDFGSYHLCDEYLILWGSKQGEPLNPETHKVANGNSRSKKKKMPKSFIKYLGPNNFKCLTYLCSCLKQLIAVWKNTCTLKKIFTSFLNNHGYLLIDGCAVQYYAISETLVPNRTPPPLFPVPWWVLPGTGFVSEQLLKLNFAKAGCPQKELKLMLKPWTTTATNSCHGDRSRRSLCFFYKYETPCGVLVQTALVSQAQSENSDLIFS